MSALKARQKFTSHDGKFNKKVKNYPEGIVVLWSRNDEQWKFRGHDLQLADA